VNPYDFKTTARRNPNGRVSGFGLDLRGLDEVQTLIVNLERVDLRQSLKEACRLVAADAKARTHSDRVRAAITWDVTIESETKYRAAVGPLRRKAFFAHFLEFGTRASAKHPFVTFPWPFLIPAAEANRERVVEIVGRAFDLPKLRGYLA